MGFSDEESCCRLFSVSDCTQFIIILITILSTELDPVSQDKQRLRRPADEKLNTSAPIKDKGSEKGT